MKHSRWLLSALLASGLAHADNAGQEVTAADAAAAGVAVEAMPAEPVASLPPGMSNTSAFSYAMGHNFGKRVSGDLPELDLEAFQQAMSDAFAGKPSLLDEQQTAMVVNTFNAQREARAQEAFNKVSQENFAKAEKFLAENGKRKGVKTTKTGLQYEVLAKGKGASPARTDVVTARYHGTLADGTVFDSTRDRGDEPVEFPLDRVIPGWTEGLQLMSRGAKYKFVVPPALAYGARAISPEIGPNQLLVFEVELLDFKAPPPPESAPEGTDANAVQ
jgi:FKBP-type peptidyl-prolyl cis-trans isomerase